jgi:hypothetical protein
LIGRAKEFRVAADLMANGLYVFYPLVDTGVDLVVTAHGSIRYIPIQVRYRMSSSGLGLKRSEQLRFRGRGLFLAYVIGTYPNERLWYVPFERWDKYAKDLDRRDQWVYVTISESEKWLGDCVGKAGIDRIKKRLIVK